MLISLRHTNHWENISQLYTSISNLLSVQDFGFDQQSFATPFQIIPITCITNAYQKSYSQNTDGYISSYLQTIHFPLGVTSDKISREGSGTYLPIARVNTNGLDFSGKEKQFKEIEDQYRELIFNCFPSIKQKLMNAVGFFFSELIENAKDHSEAENFYIFAQYWPKLKEFELCLMDDGIGLRGALSKQHKHITDDKIAVKEVIQRQLSSRISETEALPGTGIMNTLRIVSNRELESTFTLLSGNYGYSCSNDLCKWITTGTIKIPGTLINIRIKEPKAKLNIFDYIT